MKQMAGFQKPLDNGKRRQVRVAMISTGEGHMTCSCGAIFIQPRAKAREKAAAKHVDKKHGGSALWL